MARIRFHLDENIPKAVAEGLRQRGIEVTTPAEVGLLGVPDERHLAFAASRSSVIVTQDDDFLKLHSRSLRHGGIVYFHQQSKSVGEVVRFLVLLWEVIPAEEMENHVEFI